MPLQFDHSDNAAKNKCLFFKSPVITNMLVYLWNRYCIHFLMKIVLQKCGKRESGEELWKGNTMLHLLSFFNFERAHYRL